MRTRIRETLDNRWLIFAMRLALGGILLAASVTKIQYRAEFIDIVGGYGLLPDSLAQLYGLVVPWAELFIGCCLILGVFTRFASAVSIPLTVSFVVASAYGLFHPVEGGCGCFGELISLSHPVSLVLDATMLAIAFLLLLGKAGERFLSVSPLLVRYNPRSGRSGKDVFEKASKLAVVAVAMTLVVPFIGAEQGLPETETNGGPEVNSTPEELSYRREINSALEQDKPVFLSFFIFGCPPCEEQQLIINELMPEYDDRIYFMDIPMGGPSVTPEFRVGDTPTMLLVTGKDSEGDYIIYRRFEGVTDIETLREGLEQVLRSTE